MRLLFLVLMLLAHPAMAEVARLNSGEHTDFSRLVITLASPSPWSLMRDGQAQVLNFERAGITFDTSTVFDRIPRNRIADLQQQQGQSSLRIGLACDCTATAFEFRPGIIVVDVRANPASDPKTELLTEPPTMEGISAEDMLRQQLVRQLAAGAARGVVELALAPAPDAGPVLGSQSGIRLLQEPGVSMRQGGSEVTPAPDNRCIPDSELAIGDWEGAGDDPLAAKPGRAELLDALDRPIPEHVSSYVRYLIWLGFGAEARAVLNAFGSDLASIETLQSLAYLVDAEDDPLNTFAGMERCETSAALWAVLSRAVIRPSESLAVPAILRAFADLPVHLRRHFGPALVERFKAQGASDAAAQIARSLERGAGPTDPTVRLIDGTLDRSDESLISLSQESRSMEVDALVALIDASFQRHDRVESTVVENLAALLHAHGGDPTRASRLRRALALANALNGSFDEAFALAGDDQVTTLGLWALLPITANDGAFLEYAVRPRGEPLPGVSIETGLAIAERLTRLALPGPAGLWLPSDTADPGVVLARARIALQARDLASVADLLSGVDIPGSVELRARRAMLAGDFSAAEKLYGDLGEVALQKAAMRLDRNWAGIAAGGDGDWSEAARLVDPQTLDEVSLATSRALAERSADVRELAKSLLTPDVSQPD